MSIQTWDFQGINRLFGANAKRERTIEPGWLPWAFLSDVKEAQAWMQQDKANRVIEGVQRAPYGQDQLLWERVDKSKPIKLDLYLGIGIVPSRWLSLASTRKPMCTTNGLQRGPDTDLPELLLLFELVDEFKKEKRSISGMHDWCHGMVRGRLVRYESYLGR